MSVWKCKQGVDFDKSTITVKEERNRTVHQTKLSIIIFSFGYINTSCANIYNRLQLASITTDYINKCVGEMQDGNREFIDSYLRQVH